MKLSTRKETPFQQLSAWLATAFSIVALIMTVIWATKENTDESYLGGLDWGDSSKVFNWHPVLMVAGLLLCFTQGVLSFRRPGLEKSINKKLHGLWYVAAIICFGIGLKAVWKSHDDPEVKKANLYSLHSIIGITAVVLFSQNFLLGILHFFSPALALTVKKKYKPNHIFLGIFTLIMAGMAIQTGITEKNVFLGCGYSVDQKDSNPAKHYHRLTEGCQLSNGIGVVAFITLFLTLYSLVDLSSSDDEAELNEGLI